MKVDTLAYGGQMRAQVVLTPAESKKLIASAIARIGEVKRAAEEGMVVIHPSSSNYFIVEELTGHKPRTNVWCCGAVTPKGTCIEMGMAATVVTHGDEVRGRGSDFRASWVIKKGEFSTGIPLASVLSQMGPRDVYIKGVNAIDPQGKVAVLCGVRGRGGSIVSVLAARKERGFTLIIPVGLEKLIPLPIAHVIHEAQGRAVQYSTGNPCNLIPLEGDVVNEIKAIELLSGAIAIPIAAGGIGGAEGAIVLVIKGETAQVQQAIEYVEHAKGAKLPEFRTANCYDCFHKCPFPVSGKPWVND